MKKNTLSLIIVAAVTVSVGLVALFWRSPEYCLQEIEQYTVEYHRCASNQILPNQCDSILEKIKFSRLLCERNGISKDRMMAAMEIGSFNFSQDSKSPYQRINTSVTESPYYLKPVEDNFKIFSAQCSDISVDIYKVAGYLIHNGHAIYFIIREDNLCLSTYHIDEKFPVITEQQIQELKQPLPTQLFSNLQRSYQTASVVSVDALEDVAMYFERIKLNVLTRNNDAIVELLDTTNTLHTIRTDDFHYEFQAKGLRLLCFGDSDAILKRLSNDSRMIPKPCPKGNDVYTSNHAVFSFIGDPALYLIYDDYLGGNRKNLNYSVIKFNQSGIENVGQFQAGEYFRYYGKIDCFAFRDEYNKQSGVIISGSCLLNDF